MLTVHKNKLIIDWEESNFIIQEFVPKSLFEYYGEKCVWFLDHNHLKAVQFIREYFDTPMTVNDWHKGGHLQFRGFRTDEFYYSYTGNKTYKQKRKGLLSQHRFGKATDFNLSGITPDETRNKIIENKKEFLNLGLTTIESGEYSPTWVHIDSRNTGNAEDFLIVKP